MNIVRGDLIQAVIKGEVDVIVHGCNCKNTQKLGIAKQMANTFGTDKFNVELIKNTYENIDKLGRIDGKVFYRKRKGCERIKDRDFSEQPLFVEERDLLKQLIIPGCEPYYDKDCEFAVINAYTQYDYGTDKVNLDYDALRLCLRKINRICKGSIIGLPKIGCGLAGGDWNKVSKIIEEELKDCNIVIYVLE